MNRRTLFLIFLAAFLGALFAQALGMGGSVWYESERSKVLSLGQTPSAFFCQLSSMLGYYGFTREERHQCETILHPKPVMPTETPQESL